MTHPLSPPRPPRGLRPACVLAASLAFTVLAALPLSPARAEDACVWGQPGYRDCVDKLIAAKKEADARKPAQANGTAPAGPAKQTTKTTAKTPAKSRPRPGAGSLTPVPPAELRMTPPHYDPLEQAIISEQRARQNAENMDRLRQDAYKPMILPPVVNPPNGRICPSWGC